MTNFTQEQLEKYFVVLNELRNDEERNHNIYEASALLKEKFEIGTLDSYTVYSRWTKYVSDRKHLLAEAANIFED